MKKLLLIALAVSGLAFVPGQRSDAQITAGLPGVGGMSFGFPGGYYAYPTKAGYIGSRRKTPPLSLRSHQYLTFHNIASGCFSPSANLRRDERFRDGLTLR